MLGKQRRVSVTRLSTASPTRQIAPEVARFGLKSQNRGPVAKCRPPRPLAGEGWGEGRVRGLIGKWRGGRAVECTGLENRQPFTGLVSSNLTLSARIKDLAVLATRPHHFSAPLFPFCFHFDLRR